MLSHLLGASCRWNEFFHVLDASSIPPHVGRQMSDFRLEYLASEQIRSGQTSGTVLHRISAEGRARVQVHARGSGGAAERAQRQQRAGRAARRPHPLRHYLHRCRGSAAAAPAGGRQVPLPGAPEARAPCRDAHLDGADKRTQPSLDVLLDRSLNLVDDLRFYYSFSHSLFIFHYNFIYQFLNSFYLHCFTLKCHIVVNLLQSDYRL